MKKKFKITIIILMLIITISTANYGLRSFKVNSTGMVITFKMDDVQDFWQSEKQKEIIELHLQNKIPIKIAVIAGFFGEDISLKKLIIEGVNRGLVQVQNHGWNAERIENKSYVEQLKIIADSNEKLQDLLDVTPNEFVPHELAYDQTTMKVLDLLEMDLAIEEPFHVYVTEYSNYKGASFNLNEIASEIQNKVEDFGRVEIYIHFQTVTFEEYRLLFNFLMEEYKIIS